MKALAGFALLFNLGLVVGLGWVIIHFLQKYW